jgi:hypothetical protein
MNFARTAVSASALCLMLATTAAMAQGAAEPASLIGCMHMQKKVTAALESNAQSPNQQAAHSEADNARSFCAGGVYSAGVAHYAHALQLLGAS